MISANNLTYWMLNPIESRPLRVLRRIADGRQRFRADLLDVAWLIAIECVEADLDAEALSVTDKGIEALEHFEEEP